MLSLEVIVQLKQDLKVSLQSLWGQIVWLLFPMSKTHTWKQQNSLERTQFLHSFMVNKKVMSLQVPSAPFLSSCIAQASLHLQEEISTEDKVFVEVHYFCIQTHVIQSLEQYSLAYEHWVLITTIFVINVDFKTNCFFCVGSCGTERRDLYCFGVIGKWDCLEDDCRFENLKVCYGFCGVAISNYLWCAQRKGDSYS